MFHFPSICRIIPHGHIVPQIEVIIFSNTRLALISSLMTRKLLSFHSGCASGPLGLPGELDRTMEDHIRGLCCQCPLGLLKY